jgi:hypothetical protein
MKQATASWNFPSGQLGSLVMAIALETNTSAGFGGAVVALSDHAAPAWDDRKLPSVSLFALEIGTDGRLGNSSAALSFGKWVTLHMNWSLSRGGSAGAMDWTVVETGASGSASLLNSVNEGVVSYWSLQSRGAGGTCARSIDAETAPLLHPVGQSARSKTDDRAAETLRRRFLRHRPRPSLPPRTWHKLDQSSETAMQNRGDVVCAGDPAKAAEDTAAIRAAIAAQASWKALAEDQMDGHSHGGGMVQLPAGACFINSTIVLPANVRLVGRGKSTTHLFAAVANLAPMVLIEGDWAGVYEMEIIPSTIGSLPNGTFTSTSGTAIGFSPSCFGGEVADILIFAPCNGIDINGNTVKVKRVYVHAVQGKGCNGIRIGNLGSMSNTVDSFVTEVTVDANLADPPANGLLIQDSGGLLMSHTSIVLTGTLIKPGLNQQVIWATVSDSYMGDTTNRSILTIDTAHSSAQVRGLSFNNIWTSSSTAAFGVNILNSASGIVSGLHFSQLRAFNNANNAFQNLGGDSVTIDNSHFCGGAGGDTSDVVVGVGMGITVRNSAIGGPCDGFASVPAVGVNFIGNNTASIVTGNDFTGVSHPINQLPGGNSIISGNSILSTHVPSLVVTPTGALVEAPFYGFDNYHVETNGSSATEVKRMPGGWNGRKVTLFSDKEIVFGPGECFCAKAAFRSAAAPIQATYLGSCWALKTDDDDGAVTSTSVDCAYQLYCPTIEWVLKSDDDRHAASAPARLPRARRALNAPHNHHGFDCTGDEGCELNGRCEAGRCICETAWDGATCSILRLLPATLGAGYRNDSYSSWGGGAIYDAGTDEWNLFAAQFGESSATACGVGVWWPNSKIVR